MRLSTLLRLHESGGRGWCTLDCNLGDGYLCVHNPLYRSARLLATKLDYVFSGDSATLAPLYRCLPLLALEDIIKVRVVPYEDNVSPLRALIADSRDFKAPVMFYVNSVHKNYLLHEASHCIAHESLCPGIGLRELAQNDRRRCYVAALLSEGFANTIETFAIASPMDAPGSLFLTLNSYCSYNREDVGAVTHAVRELGWSLALEMTIWAFFASHLHPAAEAPPAPVVEETTEIALRRGAAKPSAAAVIRILDSAFALSPVFRQLTADAFFNCLGLTDPERQRGAVRIAAIAEDSAESVALAALLAEVTSSVAKSAEGVERVDSTDSNPPLRLNRGIRVVTDGASPSEIEVYSPVPGAELRRLRLSRKSNGDLFDVVLSVVAGLNEPVANRALPDNAKSLLYDRGILVSDRDQPEDVRLRCELPDVEQGAAVPTLDADQTPVNGFMRLLPPGEAPTGGYVPKQFGPHDALLWLRTSLGIWLPFWPNGRQMVALQSGISGWRAIRDLPGLLIASIAAARCFDTRPLEEEVLASSYSRDRHVALPALLSGPWVEALANYHLDLVRQGYLERDTGPVNQFWSYQEPIGSFLHEQLTPLASRLARTPLQPSYVFSTFYRGGAVLPAHVDRDECEHTFALLVDYMPRPGDASPWALSIVDPRTRQRIDYHQRIGDALAFRGRELPHYRRALAAEHTSTSILFHYVDESSGSTTRSIEGKGGN